jgi:pheromone shutdown protein TraB
VGRGALIYGFIAKTQARLAKSYGSAVGDEMLAAAEAAREAGVPYELIDMDSQAFFSNWMRRMSRRERAKLFLSVLGGLFTSRRRVEKELQEYYNNEEAFVDELARHFPATKTALIDERNAYMARGIVRAKSVGPVVVAVIGEGHVAGIRSELLRAGERPEEVQVVSLQDLQAPPAAPLAPVSGSNVEYSFSIKPPHGPAGPHP